MTAWERKNETEGEAEGEDGDDGAARFSAEKYKERERVRAQRGGGEIEQKRSERAFSEVRGKESWARWEVVYVLTWNHLSFLSVVQLSWIIKDKEYQCCFLYLYISLFL